MNGARDGRIFPRTRGTRLRADVGGSRWGKVGRCECGKGGRLGRRMHDKVGIVAEFTEGFCQKAEVAMPEELVRTNGEVGVEKDFQELKLRRKR